MKILLAVVCCILLILVDARSIKRDDGGNEVTTCSKSTPCGWQIYRPYDRVDEYFVQSPCKCPASTKCKEWKDDISISAYVYRCM